MDGLGAQKQAHLKPYASTAQRQPTSNLKDVAVHRKVGKQNWRIRKSTTKAIIGAECRPAPRLQWPLPWQAHLQQELTDVVKP